MNTSKFVKGQKVVCVAEDSSGGRIFRPGDVVMFDHMGLPADWGFFFTDSEDCLYVDRFEPLRTPTDPEVGSYRISREGPQYALSRWSETSVTKYSFSLILGLFPEEYGPGWVREGIFNSAKEAEAAMRFKAQVYSPHGTPMAPAQEQPNAGPWELATDPYESPRL